MRVPREHPGQAGAQLCEAEVGFVDRDAADAALIAIDLVTLGVRLAAEGQVRQVALRRLPERLCFFWGIDAVESDDVLLLVGVEQRQRVTVGDTDDAAREDSAGMRRCACSNQQGAKGGANHRLTIVEGIQALRSP